MPYRDENDPDLPDRIKRMAAKTRRQWVAVWNSVYNRCQQRGGSNCDGMAFRQANGVIAKGARPQPAIYKADEHTGAMIALFVPASVGKRFALSIPGAMDPSEFHITLAYLGEAESLTSAQIDNAHELMELIAENHPPLQGGINGCGRFCNDGEEGDPFFIIPDLPRLPNLREVIIDFLRSREIGDPPNHGYVPHITLAYIPHNAANPFSYLERLDNIVFPSISLVIGGNRYDYPLAQNMPPISKSALSDRLDGWYEVKDQWDIAKGKYDSIDFKPPKDVQAAAKRGLKLHEEGKTGSGLEAVTVAWARRVANGEAISPAKARQGNRWWGRNKRFLTFGADTPAYASAMLWFGKPGQRWFASLVRQMDRVDSEVSKMITVDGLNLSLNDLMSAMKQPAGGQRAMLQEAQQKRAKKYGIKVQPGGALTIPAKLARMGAKVEDFADPVNLRYPVWLTKPNREALSPAQLAQVRNAPARFGQFAGRYDQSSRAQVERRIDEARKKFKIGEFSERMQKGWQCTIFKRDNEKRVALSVALKASGGKNGIRPDSQNDILSAEEVEAAAYGFMLNSRQFDLHHQMALPVSRAAVVESYLSPVDFKAGKTDVRKGDWIVGVHFRDPSLWERVKKGEINAFSIKGTGKRIPFGQ